MTTNTKAKQPGPSTPTPWKIIKPYLGTSKSTIIGENHTVAHHVFNNDAAFIVRAVNSHEALVDVACKWALPYLEKLNEEKKTLGFGMGLSNFCEALKLKEGS